jgi:hypothetical protein
VRLTSLPVAGTFPKYGNDSILDAVAPYDRVRLCMYPWRRAGVIEPLITCIKLDSPAAHDTHRGFFILQTQ